MSGLADALLKIFTYEDAIGRAQDDPGSRPEIQAMLSKAALSGDLCAASAAGEVAAMDSARLEDALYWFEYAARLAVGNNDALRSIATSAAAIALHIVAIRETDFYGPATLRAMAWMAIREAVGGEDLPEEEWHGLFQDTGFDIEAVRKKARRILGAPAEPSQLN